MSSTPYKDFSQYEKNIHHVIVKQEHMRNVGTYVLK